MGWFSKYGFLGIMSAVFISSAAVYSMKWWRYRGVSSWPSVPAQVVYLRSSGLTMPIETREGPRTITHKCCSVLFRYSVAGTDYQGTIPTPDGDLPEVRLYENSQPYDKSAAPHHLVSTTQMTPDQYRAYYNPCNPNVAVIWPTPYQGTTPLIIAAFSGMLALLSAYFTLRYDP